MNITSVSSSLTHPQPHWITLFARVGLTAKGIVYCLVGLMAFMAAFDLNGKTVQDTSKAGIFHFIQEQPFGKILIGLVALGLLCFAVWRFIEAFMDTEHKGTKPKGIGRRIGYAFSGIVYLGFAFYAGKEALGKSSGQSGNDNTQQSLVHQLLDKPFGQWLVGALALGIIFLGIYQIYRAYSGEYLKKIQANQLRPEVQKLLLRAGKIGYTARGIVWGIIGFLFLKAALHANASEAGGTQNAFSFLENASFGSFLLGAVALGLIGYGIFMFVRAKCEIINTHG
ncbi:DUF1206 domain-containing protein [Adhaeribacter radiodurans]|uniref:DUF1206 domain-containing protein n=1 Tax=Adhaeribacter radiodurans TaxID=2745197 RepID=A0A7L7L8M8_9BACT|nr:DUF1206 domain-containing protein [Adhaeribacter radiodurans]QMU29177.1 DUF1206 domain-containing protein [Adhaeribacter radiodurans]